MSQDLRRKLARIVAAKCALAARVDACHESATGQIGQMFREEIEKKMEKLQVMPNDIAIVSIFFDVHVFAINS